MRVRRRTYLRRCVLGTVVALAGCADEDSDGDRSGGETATDGVETDSDRTARDDGESADGDEVTRTSIDGSWRMYRHDATNRGRIDGRTNASGSGRWQFGTENAVLSSPAVVDRTVYVGSTDGSVYAVSITDGDQQWRRNLGSSVLSSPAVADDTVFIVDASGTVRALSTGDGSERWQAQQESFATGYLNRVERDRVRISSPTVAGETVYVGGGDGNVYALATEDGSERWRAEAGGYGAYIAGTPAVADDSVYVCNDSGYVYAFATRDGSTRWRSQVGNPFDQESLTVAVADGTVYVAGDGLHTLSTEDGNERWQYTPDSGTAVAPPAVTDDRVYVPFADTMYAISTADGELDWRFGTGDTIHSPPTVTDDTVYFGSDDNSLYALARTDGTERWTYDTNSWIRSSPAASDAIVVGSHDSRVHAIE